MIARDILDVATPSMRPRWIGRTKPKPMTSAETCVLMLALVAGDRLRYRDVQDNMGGEPWPILDSLRSQGALEHVGYDHWRITEKGRIAAAFARAKNPDLAELFPMGDAP